MILKPIIAQLKTGSISNVQTRGNYTVYPNGEDSAAMLTPYVLVYDDYPVSAYYTENSSVHPVVVDVHFPMGFIDQLNDYVEYELVTLLNHKRLITDDGYTFQVFVTMYMSIMSEPNDDRAITGGNDDGTISRFRRIFVPRRGI